MKKVFNPDTGEFQYEFDVKIECFDGSGNGKPSGLIDLFKMFGDEEKIAVFEKQIQSENYEMAELLKDLLPCDLPQNTNDNPLQSGKPRQNNPRK